MRRDAGFERCIMSITDRTTERPLTFSRRRDLIVVRQRFGDTPYWVVKDPVSFRFVRLREPEFVLFEAIDGHRSLLDLVALYEVRFAPSKFALMKYHVSSACSTNRAS